MLVLAGTLLAYITAALLAEHRLFGEQDVYVRFAVLALVHSAAGWISWSSDYHSWGDRLLWMGALVLHTLTYSTHWSLYAIAYDVSVYPDLTQGQANLIQNLVILLIIVCPSLLMYGGPVRTILRLEPKPEPGEE